MVRLLSAALVAGSVLSGGTAVMAAEIEFSDFPAVPDVVRFEESFRDAGFYAGTRGGIAFAQDTDFAIIAATRVDNTYELGIAGSAFFGFEVPDLYLGVGVRLEGELSYSQFDVDTHTVGGALISADNSLGSTDAFMGMANLYVDYGLGAFRPFIGGGIGVARLDFDAHGLSTATGVMDDTDNGFAWQAMGGLAYDVNSALTVEAMVRYQNVMDVGLVSATGPASSVDLSNTQVLLGARFSF